MMERSGVSSVRKLLVPAILIAVALSASAQNYQDARRRMVANQIAARGIKDPRVLDAMLSVERHLFVPEDLKDQSYEDHPIPIGEGQTISQPYIVALMTEALRLTGKEKVLEIGTGSGYQAAILSRLAREVCSIEIKKVLFDRVSRLLPSLGYGSVESRFGDGYYGWQEKAPFDCIMITASVNHVPPPLLAQLSDGGRLILPLGNAFGYQDLVLVTKQGNTFTTEAITGVLFVPMTGKALEGQR